MNVFISYIYIQGKNIKTHLNSSTYTSLEGLLLNWKTRESIKIVTWLLVNMFEFKYSSRRNTK